MEPLTVTIEHDLKPERAQEINGQLAGLFVAEVAKLLFVSLAAESEPLENPAEDVIAFLCSLNTGHEIKAHPITEEDRKLCRIRYTITEPPQSQRVAVGVTTEKP